MNVPVLHPKEIIEWTSEYYAGTMSKPTRFLYLIVLSSFLILICILPFVTATVSVKNSGLLHAVTETNSIKAPASGIVKFVSIHENSSVKKGQLLFSVESPLILEKAKNLTEKIREDNVFLRDLETLSRLKIGEENGAPHLSTHLYQQTWIDFNQKAAERQNRLQKASVAYNRNKKLFNEHVISAVEFENFEFEYAQALTEKELFFQSQLNTWQQDLRSLQKEIQEFQHQVSVTQQEKENLQIYSPVNGTIQNLAGIYPGSPVFVNQDLAQLSPDTTLVAEVYVTPDNIGLLKTGMDVKMQVNAFHFHQWGLLTGKVIAISDDILIRNDQPFFKVKCSLTQNYLELKNGYKGTLKKGMTITCRFLIAERTLWQLLYDKADSWVNPDIIPEQKTKSLF
jgi:multidrug resistance efflux pump